MAGPGHPLDDQFRALVRHHQLRTAPLVEGLVVAQAADGTLELELAEELGLGAGLSGVPIALPPGVTAIKLAPTPPARALLEFIDDGPGKPQRPIVRQFLEAAYLEVSMAASSKLSLAAPAVDVGNAGATVKLAGGTKPVIRAGDQTAVGLVAGPNPVTGTFAAAAPGTVLA